MNPTAMQINLNPIKLPREVLAAYIRQWLESYETARKTQGASDLADPELLSLNAKALANHLGNQLDSLYTAAAGELIKQVSMHAYSAGLGKPLPTFTIGQETPPAKLHPSRAVQRVERDPETLEVTRTVTEYE